MVEKVRILQIFLIEHKHKMILIDVDVIRFFFIRDVDCIFDCFPLCQFYNLREMEKPIFMILVVHMVLLSTRVRYCHVTFLFKYFSYPQSILPFQNRILLGKVWYWMKLLTCSGIS